MRRFDPVASCLAHRTERESRCLAHAAQTAVANLIVTGHTLLHTRYLRRSDDALRHAVYLTLGIEEERAAVAPLGWPTGRCRRDDCRRHRRCLPRAA